MQVRSYRTELVKSGDQLLPIITRAISSIPERSILVIASKLLATSERRFVPKITGEKSEKHQLVQAEADWYLPAHSSKYNLMLTIKNNYLFVNAGIDESNADNHYLLWPANPQASACLLWQQIRDAYHLSEFGLTVSDSTSMPLNWGVIGHAIAYCGFQPLKSYIGTKDLFGREMVMEQVNIMQSVTAAAVLEMGEGNERTPIAIVSDIKDVVFQSSVPTEVELAALRVAPEDDAYAPAHQAANWQRGGSGYKI